MTQHDEDEESCSGRENDNPRRIKIVLPRARSIAWLGFKVYVIAVVGVSLLLGAAMLLGVTLIAAMR